MTHTERFEQMVAAKRAREAANPTCSWRKIDQKFGGGYSGLGSNGVRVYVQRAAGGWEYGLRDGKENRRHGTRRLLPEARGSAEQIVRGGIMSPKARTRLTHGWAFMKLTDAETAAVRTFLGSGDPAHLPARFQRADYGMYE